MVTLRKCDKCSGQLETHNDLFYRCKIDSFALVSSMQGRQSDGVFLYSKIVL